MPRWPLLRMKTLIGIRSMVQVASSWAVIWKQPSPSMATTSYSGRRTLAPPGPAPGEAPRPQPAGVDPGPGAVEAELLGGVHLVLADPGHHHRLPPGQGRHPLGHGLGLAAAGV